MNEKPPSLSFIGAASLKSVSLGWGMVFLYVLFNSLGAFALKMEVEKLGSSHFSTFRSFLSFFPTLFSSWQTWLGLGSVGIATGSWIIALAHLELSKAYPAAIGSNLLIAMTLSFVQFQEPLTFSKLLGASFIFTGVLLCIR